MENTMSGESKNCVFRFTGEIESITDGQTLWVKNGDLTIPVSLEETKCWLLPAQEEDAGGEAPEKIHWNRISTFTEGVKVFIGGRINLQNNRMIFSSTKEKPLMVIFYNCPETVLTEEVIRASRTRGEYWNSFSSVSLVLGALALVFVAVSFLNRPAFHITVISALVAMFVPILPMFPPGILLTVVYRRMAWHARRYRALRDLARLPIVYLGGGAENCVLSTGEKYGFIKLDSLPGEDADGSVPFLIPDTVVKEEKSPWYFFGVIEDSSSGAEELPVKSSIKPSIDPFVSFGLLPDEPEKLARFFSIKAYSLEATAWLILITSITINIVFIFLILFLLGIVSV